MSLNALFMCMVYTPLGELASITSPAFSFHLFRFVAFPNILTVFL